jgi:hypothetical protein
MLLKMPLVKTPAAFAFIASFDIQIFSSDDPADNTEMLYGKFDSTHSYNDFFCKAFQKHFYITAAQFIQSNAYLP